MKRFWVSASLWILFSGVLMAAPVQESGRLLAAGPAWAVDVAQLSGPASNGTASLRAQSDITYIPADVHWVTYVIRCGDTTYITRENTKLLPDVEATTGSAVTFKVSGSHLIWKTTLGHKHTAHLVIR